MVWLYQSLSWIGEQKDLSMGTVGSSSWRHRHNIEMELDRRWKKAQEQWTAKTYLKVAIPKRALYQFLKRRPKSRILITELWAEEVAQVEGGRDGALSKL